MQHKLVLAAGITAALSTLSGCALNDMFDGAQSGPAPVEQAAPLPPRADSLPAAQSTAAQPVLTEDMALPSISRAPTGTALEVNQGMDIRGSSPALERLPSDSEVLLGSINSVSEGDSIEQAVEKGEVEILRAPERAPEPARPMGVGAVLPDYASGSNLGGSCDFALNNAAKLEAQSQASAMAAKLKLESGTVYVAPTIIPDAYLDCTEDLSEVIGQALSAGGNFTVLGGSSAQQVELTVSQNSGSASTLPLLIRTLRSSNVPYLLVSSLRQQGDDVALILRFVRVSDGITLTQSFKKLELNQTTQ